MSIPTPDRAPAGTLRGNLARYLPVLAVALALATWVAAVPSTRSRESNVTTDSLFGPAGEGGALGASGTGTGGGPGATDPATGQPVGTGGSAGSAGVGVATAGTNAAGRVVGGAAATAQDCSRLAVTGGTVCRPPRWTGDNGGATYRGVTRDKIRVVVYQVKANEQVQAILAANGAATDAHRQAAAKAITKWINENVELYGRRIETIYYLGSTPANDAAGQQADAVHVAEELDPFAVLTIYPAPIFHEELHRRGIVNFTWNQFPAAFHEANSPHLFGLFPDRDTTLDHLVEYYCKRLNGRRAIHAGDLGYQGQVRKLGVIYQDSTNNGPYLAARLKASCGVQPVKMVSYPADIGNAVAISTNAVTQLQQAGVTTVTCICDVIAPLFFTGQATKQGWFPEWLHNGYFVTDADAAGRLYEQTQWSHSFGVSTIAFPGLLKDNAGYRVCRAGGGDHTSCLKAQVSYYAFFALLAAALETNGPNLTDLNVARSMVNLPPFARERPNEFRMSLGRQGPGPYTLIDDVMEIWYDPNRTGPDGKRGSSFLVRSGFRYLAGEWPATDPEVFVDDGSPQPPRDPDRV